MAHLILKAAFVALLIQLAIAVHHHQRHHDLKDGSDPFAFNLKLKCHGEPAYWHHPFLTTPSQTAKVVASCKLNGKGECRIRIPGDLALDHQYIMEIRHNCEIPGVGTEPECRMPFTTTIFKFNTADGINNFDRDLKNYADESHPSCAF